MNWFVNLKISAKLTICFFVIIVLTGVVGFIGFSSSKIIHEGIEEIFTVNVPGAGHIMKTETYLKDAVLSERAMIFTEVDDNAFSPLVDEYEYAVKAADEEVAKFKALPLNEEKRQYVEKFEKAKEEWKVLSRKIVEGRREDTREGRALAIDLTLGDGKKKFEEMTAYLKKLDEAIQQENLKDHASASSTYKWAVVYIAGFMVAALVISVALAFIVTRTILKQLGGEPAEVVVIARQVADGNLTVDAGAHDSDAGSVYAAMQRMVGNLKKIMGNVKSSAYNLASASEELSAGSEQMSSGVTEQANRAAQIATASSEMSQTIVNIAGSLSTIAASAVDTSRVAMDGKEIFNKTVSEVRTIADTVSDSAELMTSLGERSKQIGEIINVINDIAEQTNLLALNAAIEAARAGEQGRGFAVVADEVRKLAERTAKATSEIGGMIKAIQDEVNKAVASMDEGKKSVETGVQFSIQAGEVLNRIVESVEELKGMVQQIAASTEEISTASEQISGDIDTIANISKETLSSTSQVAQASSGLARLSSDLQGIVQQFTI
ncbi:MAG: methyl-accepting chemotaxis protein [Nitrospirota bacterium]